MRSASTHAYAADDLQAFLGLARERIGLCLLCVYSDPLHYWPLLQQRWAQNNKAD
jgi:hypothetical protein